MNTEAKMENAHAGVTFPPPLIFQARVLGDFLIFLGESIGNLVRWALLDPLKHRNQRSRRTREFSRLNDRTLKDIGLTRLDMAYVARYGTHPGYRGA